MTAEQLKAAIRAFIYDKDAYTSNGAANVVHAMDLLIDELDGGGGSGGGETPGIADVLGAGQDAEGQNLTNVGQLAANEMYAETGYTTNNDFSNKWTLGGASFGEEAEPDNLIRITIDGVAYDLLAKLV